AGEVAGGKGGGLLHGTQASLWHACHSDRHSGRTVRAVARARAAEPSTGGGDGAGTDRPAIHGRRPARHPHLRKEKESELNYGEGRVFLRGKIWHIAWHENGVEERESTHQTDELVARQRLREKLEMMRAGRRPLSSKELTVERLCDEVVRKYKRKNQNVEDALTNQRIWTRALGATTVLHKVADRVSALIEEWQEAEEDEQGRPLDDGYSDATINRRMAFLQTGARELEFQPLWDIAKKHRIREDNVRDAYMNPDEFM